MKEGQQRRSVMAALLATFTFALLIALDTWLRRKEAKAEQAAPPQAA
jgi:hypothetical protein